MSHSRPQLVEPSDRVILLLRAVVIAVAPDRCSLIWWVNLDVARSPDVRGQTRPAVADQATDAALRFLERHFRC